MGGKGSYKPVCVGLPPLTPKQRFVLEKKFTLDCVAVATLSDVTKNSTNPCVQVTLPLYNPQKDKSCTNYFQFKGVKQVLKRTQQNRQGTSQHGKVLDKYINTSHAVRDVTARNKNGAGYSIEYIAGHYSSPVYKNVKPMTSYNGNFGYRRNVPTLRQYPSCFQHPVSAAFHPNGSARVN